MSSIPNLLSVSKQFVHSYYNILHRSPQDLHRFYKEDSSFTHGFEATYGTPDETARGLEKITNKIQQLDFQKCRVTLSVVDVQASIQGGIIIMVVGHLSNKEESPRKFVQTFFLAEQSNANGKGYYVHNDIFRYLDEGQEVGQENEREEQEITLGHSQEGIIQKESEPDVPVESSVIKEQIEVIEQEEIPPKASFIPVAATSPNVQEESNPLPMKKSAPMEATKPKNWAGVVSKSNSQTPIDHPSPPKVPSQAAPQKSTTSQARKDEKPGNPSLFVSNVPFNATEEQVKTIFSKIGEVSSVSVNKSKGIAFIDMANPDIALKAIESARNGELVLDGRPLKVEEKKLSKQGSFKGEKERGSRVDKRPRDKGEGGDKVNGKTSGPRDQRRQ